MVIPPLSLQPDYWDTFEIEETDLDFLYNYLLENETPLTSQDLISELIQERIRIEKESLINQQPEGAAVYAPKEHYQKDDTLVFPAMSWQKGRVTAIRAGYNPEYAPFDVIEVQFDNGKKSEFAAGIENHPLNQPLSVNVDDPLLDPRAVFSRYGNSLVHKLEASLGQNPDLVRIAQSWFPRALLVDVNIGYLNLAEAVLDMSTGGPLSTKAILEQIELPTDVNPKLTEFSLNLALQEDPRFDEVGPAGDILWYLQRLEPEAVRQTPLYIRHHSTQYEPSSLSADMQVLEAELDDEWTPGGISGGEDIQEATVRLTYPHWRAGTLPLTPKTQSLFPTAFESPRIQFTLVLGEDRTKSSGWVVRQNRYVYGLREWFINEGLIPGNLIHIQKGQRPEEVIVRAEKHRSTREWIRTVLVGADNGLVFAMLKQQVSAVFDERMAIVIPDVEAVDKIWEQSSRQRNTFENSVVEIIRELGKLNPQGHVHAQEVYAALNVVRRCPPGPIFALLASRPWFIHVGDMYFRLDEAAQRET